MMSEQALVTLLYATIILSLAGFIFVGIKDIVLSNIIKRDCEKIIKFLTDELHLEGHVNIYDLQGLAHVYYVEYNDKCFYASVEKDKVQITPMQES